MPRPDTKSRIVRTALKMFNEERFGTVTTAALADRLGMAEGNLWYHFNNKRDLLKAITDLFIPRVEARLALRPAADGNVLDDYANMLLLFRDELIEFCFLYRDQSEYGGHTKKLMALLPTFFGDTFTQFDAFHQAMIEHDLMEDRSAQIAACTEASIIAFRFNLEFYREYGMAPGETPSGPGGAIDLHVRLFEPLMLGDTATRLRQALSENASMTAP